MPIKEYDYCPSFKMLKNQGKSCKSIINSSINTNNIYTLASELCILPKFSIKPINTNKNIKYKNLKIHNKTRKIKQKTNNLNSTNRNNKDGFWGTINQMEYSV